MHSENPDQRLVRPETAIIWASNARQSLVNKNESRILTLAASSTPIVVLFFSSVPRVPIIASANGPSPHISNTLSALQYIIIVNISTDSKRWGPHYRSFSSIDMLEDCLSLAENLNASLTLLVGSWVSVC